jgi:hypothetical protein
MLGTKGQYPRPETHPDAERLATTPVNSAAESPSMILKCAGLERLLEVTGDERRELLGVRQSVVNTPLRLLDYADEHEEDTNPVSPVDLHGPGLYRTPSVVARSLAEELADTPEMIAAFVEPGGTHYQARRSQLHKDMLGKRRVRDMKTKVKVMPKSANGRMPNPPPRHCRAPHSRVGGTSFITGWSGPKTIGAHVRPSRSGRRL